MSTPELQLAAPLTRPSSSVVYALSMALLLMRQVERVLLLTEVHTDDPYIIQGRRRVRRLCLTWLVPCFGASARRSARFTCCACYALSSIGTSLRVKPVCKIFNLNCISVKQPEGSLACRCVPQGDRKTVSCAFSSVFVKMMAKRKRQSPQKAVPTTGNKQQKLTKGVSLGASARPPPGVTKAAKGRAVSGAKRGGGGGRYYPCARHSAISLFCRVCLTHCGTLKAQQSCCSQASEKASTR